MMKARPEVKIDRVELSVYRIPTDCPESDGTLGWNSTSLLVVEAHGGNKTGLGYTYAGSSAAAIVRGQLEKKILGHDAMAVRASYDEMVQAVRNLGRPGVCGMAISAMDVALWDLKARLLEVPLLTLLGPVREAIPIYGSGGFTSYSMHQLVAQLKGWVEQGIPRLKMKIGRDPGADLERVKAVREAVGAGPELFVDANGAYSRKQALAQAEAFCANHVCWFEEPVSSDDLEGLRWLRDRVLAPMDITAGEYGYDPIYFRRMLESQAVDVLQPDGTRCGGLTGFMEAAALCDAFGVSLSAHTAPALHMHPCCAAPRARHLEYFHDHVRIERIFFEGVSEPRNGTLRPDLTRPGLGLELKRSDAQQYAV